MNRIYRHCLLLLIAFVALRAQGAHGMPGSESPVKFVENRGQWEPQVRFVADLPLGRAYLEDGQIRYAFCDTRDLHERFFHRDPKVVDPMLFDCHAFTVRFVGSNPAAWTQGEEVLPGYHNYFLGNDPSRWAGNVPLYRTVRYRDIYPGIDFVLYGVDKGLKYDFIVHPGADPRQIQMAFDGLTPEVNSAGALVMRMAFQEIVDNAPVAYVGPAKAEWPCAFAVQNGTVGFAIPEGYNTGETLVIDPTMVFSTYSGSLADNFGFTATYDDYGDLYAGGIAYGQGYPVTNGAYQTLFGGGSFDVSISKFSTTGNHMYSTYIGGNSNDQPHSMIADASGNLYIMGRTYSGNFPTVSGAYDQSQNGGSDFFVCRVSASGSTLMGSTFVGGSGDEALNVTGTYQQVSTKYNYGDDARGEIVLDGSGNVYVAGCTKSSNFPTTAGALQNAPGSSQDGCVFRLNPTLGNLDWSTYLGGSGNDAAYGIKAAADQSVFVAGGTESNNFPTTAGTVSPSYNGAIDGFIVHLDDVGGTLMAGTYIGTAGYNQCYFIELDSDEEVYVVGQKTGVIPITPGVWSTPAGGQFIQKLNNDLTGVIYSTQFGTSSAQINISPTAFLVDVCEYVYVSGWGGATNFGGSTTGLPVTNDAFQSTTDGSDIYILVLQKDAVALDFATYVGGSISNEHVDGGTSRFNKAAEIYQSVCAGCWSNSDFPTTPNAYSNTNNSSGCNLACFKMELPLPGIRADFTPTPAQTGCAPHTVNFINQSNGGNQFYWNFADPTSGAQNTSTLFNPAHTFNNPGIYTVMLVAVDSASCNIADTSYEIIVVNAQPLASVVPDTNVCLGDGVALGASGGQTYLWSPATGLSSTTAASPTASPTTTTTYTVIVSNTGGCADTAQVTVEVLAPPTAAASGGGFICPGDSTTLSASGGVGYAWSNPSSLSAPTAANTWAFPTGTTTYVVTVTATNGCDDTAHVTVSVSAVQAQAGPDAHICAGESTQLNGSGGGTYAWDPPTGLSSTTIANPTANPTTTTTYTLTVTDQYGCEDTDVITVNWHPLPTVQVGPDIVMCQQDSVLLNAIGALQYQWFPPSGLSNPNSASTFASPMTDVTYVVTGADQWGCEDTDTISIQVLPAPLAVATGGPIICEDSSVQVFATGGMAYEWAPQAVFNNHQIQNPVATLSNTTNLIVRAIGANGCDDLDTLRIEVIPTPIAEGLGDRLMCMGHSGTLFATGGDRYLWSTGDTSRHIVVSPDSTASYTLTTWVQGCPSKPDTVQVVVDRDLPVASFWASPDSGWIPLEVTFHNESVGASSFQWTFGDGTGSTLVSPTHTYDQDTGRYWVCLVAFNGNGCPDTLMKRIIVGADFTIYVPNAFTPNGDGLNDYWETPWIGVKEFHVMLFDRWGMMIYESFDPDFRWYGALHGEACQEGVYVYVIEARGHLSEKVKRSGTVTLIR